MDRRLFEEWWTMDAKSAPNPKEYAWQAWQAAISNQSLSQEAVRDEVLELRRLVKVLADLAVTESEIEQEFMHGPRVIFEKGRQIAVRDVLMARKALKREPNVAIPIKAPLQCPACLDVQPYAACCCMKSATARSLR